MLIVDMPMPIDCVYCPMSHWNKLDEFTGCEVAAGKLFAGTTDEEYAESIGRPDWCPIKGELVRCGECKHYLDTEKVKERCALKDRAVYKTDFCSYGERRDGAK